MLGQPSIPPDVLPQGKWSGDTKMFYFDKVSRSFTWQLYYSCLKIKLAPPVTVISAVKVNILLYPILFLQIRGRRDLQTGDSEYSAHRSRESAGVLLQRQVRLANIFINSKVILFVTLIKLNDQDKTS